MMKKSQSSLMCLNLKLFFKTFKVLVEPLDKPEKKELKPSIEEPPILELKPLPSHLKYVYLGADSTLPVVISNELSKEQEERLVQVLKEHKKAIGWTIADIRGINSMYCQHKIL